MHSDELGVAPVLRMRSTAEGMAVAEVVLRNAAELVSQFLGKHAPDGGVSFRFCKTPKYGDVFASRETAILACAVSVVCGCGLWLVCLLVSIPQGCKPEDMLSSPRNVYFNKVTVNPQGHLCLHLNRPVLFTECIKQISTEQNVLGTSNLTTPTTLAPPPPPPAPPVSVLLMSHTSFSKVKGQLSADVAFRGDECSHKATASFPELSLDDARVILTTGLLRNVLQATGQTVCHPCRRITEAEVC